MLPVARMLLILGILFIIISGVIFLLARTGIQLGRLPGDIRIQTGNVTCVFPIVTSILLSILLTIVLNIIVRFFNR